MIRIVLVCSCHIDVSDGTAESDSIIAKRFIKSPNCVQTHSLLTPHIGAQIAQIGPIPNYNREWMADQMMSDPEAIICESIQ